MTSIEQYLAGLREYQETVRLAEPNPSPRQYTCAGGCGTVGEAIGVRPEKWGMETTQDAPSTWRRWCPPCWKAHLKAVCDIDEPPGILVGPVSTPEPAAPEREYRFTEADVLRRLSDPHEFEGVLVETGTAGSADVVTFTPILNEVDGIREVDDAAAETFRIDITREEHPR